MNVGLSEDIILVASQQKNPTFYSPHSVQTWYDCKICETARNPGDPSSTQLPEKVENKTMKWR